MGGIREGKWQFPKLSELHRLVAAAAALVVVVFVVATPICSCSSLLLLSLCFVICPLLYGFFTI